MQKIFFRNALAQCGIGALVIALAFIGSFLIREARSFVNPASGPGASGVLGPDVGVIGNPADGISGAPTLFQGQAAIKTAVDAVGGGGGGGLRTKRVFVTSTVYTGNLGGLAGADAKCQARADAATLGGTWKAILSDNLNPAYRRIGYNWDVLVDTAGIGITNKWSMWGVTDRFWNGSSVDGMYLYQGIIRDENGINLGASGVDLFEWGDVWSGTDDKGTYIGDTCNVWTSSSSPPNFGSVGDMGEIQKTWIYTQITSIDCSTTKHLYCIEQ